MYVRMYCMIYIYVCMYVCMYVCIFVCPFVVDLQWNSLLFFCLAQKARARTAMTEQDSLDIQCTLLYKLVPSV